MIEVVPPLPRGACVLCQPHSLLVKPFLKARPGPSPPYSVQCHPLLGRNGTLRGVARLREQNKTKKNKDWAVGGELGTGLGTEETSLRFPRCQRKPLTLLKFESPHLQAH